MQKKPFLFFVGAFGLSLTVACQELKAEQADQLTPEQGRQEQAEAGRATGITWETDFDQALAQAKKEGRLVLAEFTGSDWCPPCMQLRKKILGTEEFAAFVTDHGYLPVELDFPKNPENVAKLSEETMMARENVMNKYGISGFPSVLISDEQGMPYRIIVGHSNLPPGEYIGLVKEAEELCKTFKKSIADAMNLNGKERADALVAALKTLPENLQAYQTGVIDQIIADDPGDEYGYAKIKKDKEDLITQTKRFNDLTLKYSGTASNPAMLKKAIEEAKQMVETEEWQPSIRQKLHRFIGESYAIMRDMENYFKYYKLAIEDDPTSKEAEFFRRYLRNNETQGGVQPPAEQDGK